MNNFHRIILYHKCVCGILLRKLKKYSKYTMKTWPENSWHIYMMCYFNLVIGWCMQGWLKGQSHILKTAIMVPSKRLSRAIAATFWPRGRRARSARRPRGPNVKNSHWNHIEINKSLTHSVKNFSQKKKKFLFLPEASFGLWVFSLPASVCLSVYVCINHLFVRTITHQLFKLGSPNLNHRCKTPWLRSL